nr:ferric reduction oxidase 2 [Quercus suber]
MRRITPRTCLWPATICICISFALSIGLTYRSNHHCFAGTCGEWLFPLQARLHVVVWYMWISITITFLSFRTFHPGIGLLVSKPLGVRIPLMRKQLRLSGLGLGVWILSLYGIIIGIWWIKLRDYFQERGEGLPGNNILAAIALTGHLADVTTGMVILPVSRHSSLASFFKLSPSTIYTFHMTQAYVLFGLIIIHAALYASWAALYNESRDRFRYLYPVLNPTYLYHEVWPGSKSSLGIWRASLIFTGSVSALIMAAMFFTSFPAIRRRYFNVFYFTHLLGIVAVIIICLHASTMFYCTIPGLSMWMLDWGMRVFELREKLKGRLMALGNGWFSITLALPDKRLSGCACHSPLAHFYIHHHGSSSHEIHPFTTITHLASQKNAIDGGAESVNIQFLFRPSVPTVTSATETQLASQRKPQWTNRLTSLLDVEKAQFPSDLDSMSKMSSRSAAPSEFINMTAEFGVETLLRLEGPYFTPANPQLFSTVICLVAGTGLSGAIAIAAQFKAQRKKTASNDGTSVCKTCIVIWSVRECDYVDMPFFQDLRCDGLEFRVQKTGKGRPRLDMTKTLKEICGDHGDDTWCYISGPNGFITAAEQACSKVDDDAQEMRSAGMLGVVESGRRDSRWIRRGSSSSLNGILSELGRIVTGKEDKVHTLTPSWLVRDKRAQSR